MSEGKVRKQSYLHTDDLARIPATPPPVPPNEFPLKIHLLAIKMKIR